MIKRVHKYNAERTCYNGSWYASKAEAQFAKHLNIMRYAKDLSERVVDVKRQVRFALTGGIVYVVDFVVSYADGSTHYFEVKGFETPIWKLKMKLMRERYPSIKIEVVKCR